MKKIVTPISSLLLNKNAKNIIENSTDYFELRHFDIKELNKKKILFYHCDLQLNHRFEEDDINDLNKILSLYPYIKHFSFHLASIYKNPKINKRNIFTKGNKKISRSKMLKNVYNNVKLLKTNFPKIHISVENNNYYNTGAYKYVCDPNFISEVVLDSNILFLFDLSHAQISSRNLNIKFDEYINLLPLKKVEQIHISRPSIKHKMYLDSHYLPNLNKFTKDIISFINPKFLTVEYYKNYNRLNQINNSLREL